MSKQNTYFGTKYSEIIREGKLVKLPKESEFKNPAIIPVTEVKFWKQHQSMSDLTPEVFGCEAGDNARDAWASEFIVRLSGKRESGKYSSVEYLDTGNPMIFEDMLERFSLTPKTTYDYTDKSIGCRGGGAKIEDNKEGFRKGFRQVKKGSQNMTELTIYIPLNKKNEDLIIEDLDKKKFKNEVYDVRQEIWEVPTKILNCQDREKKSKEVYLWPDCFNLDPNTIAEFMSRRYSQVDKFNVIVEDVSANSQIEKKQVFFRQLDKNENAISDISMIPRYKDRKFEVAGRYFHLRYHFRLSKKWDKKRYGQWKKRIKDVGIENTQLIMDKGFRYDQPLMQVYDKNKIWLHTGARNDFWSDWSATKRPNLEVLVEFTDDISDMTSLIKSRGFSDDDFEKALTEKVLSIIKNDTTGAFITPHYDKIIQNERPEVSQFIDNIQKDFGLQYSFMGLNPNWTIERLSKKSNWKNSTRIGKPAREVDCRFEPKDIPSVWFEFQSSASDYGHLDGIFSRTSLFNVNKKDYDTIIWVAKSFDGKEESLEEYYKTLDWGGSNLRKVYLITTKQLGLTGDRAGFLPQDIIEIDVEKIIDSEED